MSAKDGHDGESDPFYELTAEQPQTADVCGSVVLGIVKRAGAENSNLAPTVAGISIRPILRNWLPYMRPEVGVLHKGVDACCVVSCDLSPTRAEVPGRKAELDRRGCPRPCSTVTSSQNWDALSLTAKDNTVQHKHRSIHSAADEHKPLSYGTGEYIMQSHPSPSPGEAEGEPRAAEQRSS